MYDLFILGELLDQPMHGYLLRDVVNRAFGFLRQISWGSLYPLIRRLEADGYITHVASRGDKTRRKTYAITPRGEAHFYSLMRRQEAYTPEYAEIITVKLVNFDHLGSADRLAILEHYRGYLHYGLEQLDSSEHFVQQAPGIPGSERALITRVISRKRAIYQADLLWLDAQIQDFSKGERDETSAP